MLYIVLSGIFLHWELRQFSAIFVLMGVVAGLAGGMGWRGTSEQFAEGFRRLALAAIVVGFARAISVVLRSGLISGLITPTAGALLAMLAIAGVSYGKWLRFVAVPFALLFTLAVAATVIGVKLGIQ